MRLFHIQILVVLFFTAALHTELYAQEKQLVKVLNKALREEVKVQKKDPGNYCGELFEVVAPYSINGTKLSVTIKKQLPEEEGYITETHEVVLDSIVHIVKDINILFETWPGAVTVTRHTIYKNAPATTEVFGSALFFLQLCHEKNNEIFADELIKAFKKEGYTIKKSHWYD